LLNLSMTARQITSSPACDSLPSPMRLPSVALPATNGSQVCLAELPSRAVLIVHPWTGRPGHSNPPGWDEIPGAHGSTPELEGFRDLAPAFAAYGTVLYALSQQTTAYQGEMAKCLDLPFPVLSDAERRLATAFSLAQFRSRRRELPEKTHARH
jgi:peroxiredoxin